MSTSIDAERRPSALRNNAGFLAIVALVLLTLTALLPFAAGGFGDAGLLAMVIVGAIAVLLVLPRVSGGLTDQPDANRRSWWRAAIEMALYLSPVLLLTTVFPFATHRIVDVHIGGAPLILLILASSVTVPWLSQAVCLPVYRAIGPLIPEGDMDAIQRRFCQVWASTFVRDLGEPTEKPRRRGNGRFRTFTRGWAAVNFNSQARRKITFKVPDALRDADGTPAPERITLGPHEGAIYRRPPIDDTAGQGMAEEKWTVNG